MHPIAGIDHVIVGVRDLEAARRTWSRLGFTLSPRGRHVEQPTANYCVMFASDYIELLGMIGADVSGHRLGDFLGFREGLMGIAFAPLGSAEEARAALAERGLHPSAPRALSCKIELPEGAALPRFDLVSLPPDETPGLDCVLCSHLTPELMRRREWLDHPNGAAGLEAVHVLVDNTAPLLPAYDRLFGIGQVTTTDAVASIMIGHQRLVFSTIDDFQTMHPGSEVDREFPLPGIVALEIAVARRDSTAAYLNEQQIAFSELPDGAVAVPGREANGAILFFREG
ncbi:MAG TPA: VOC family protein [Stellaceae bacterium]|jgi:catechol 2,3-dioxygenase-like lactoylglutathione lyase family enzyme